MKKISICDTTLSYCADNEGLAFRKKLDIASILDKQGVDVIELGELPQTTESRLLIKSVASGVNCATLSVSVGFQAKNVAFAFDALREAKRKRLQVTASLSTQRMEYVYHIKAKDMLGLISEAVAECRKFTEDVEFCAHDATRADLDFLQAAVSEAVKAGATTITLCDTSGDMLPAEFGEFLRSVDISGARLGVECNNSLGLADALAIEALICGATEIKAAAAKDDTASLSGIVSILAKKGEALGIESAIRTESFAHNIKAVDELCNLAQNNGSPFDGGMSSKASSIVFTENDTRATVDKEIESLGYIVSEEDKENIFASFKQIVAKKKQIDLHELEVIVAAESMKVPQTYRLVSFVVTTGNAVDTVAHVKLEKNGAALDGISLGNGSVDASFLAIEKILDCHYELDDFQIQALTEGKEAMGQTLVKLRSKGKVYSGMGISTDIVSSAVNAYINALNKICYEEEQ